MEKTLLGVIQVDPRRILEEGLRKELVRKVSEVRHPLHPPTLPCLRPADPSSSLPPLQAMHELLVFPSSSSGQEVGRVMGRLALRMSAFQRSSEYVQDYIDLPGLKLWQQELSRVVYYNIEQVRHGYQAILHAPW
jgi:WASH complex subunit strumpellin